MKKNFPKTKANKRKSLRRDDELLSCEKKLRSYSPERDSRKEKVRFLLPTKEKNVLTYRAVKEVEFKPKYPATKPVEQITKQVEDVSKPMTNAELVCLREELLQSRRKQLASICSKILEDPYSKCALLSNLTAFCTEKEPLISLTVRRLGLLSSLTVVKDIMPGYKIRESYEENENQGKMLSKEVKQARAFEATFLSSYKLYLNLLQLYLTHNLPKQVSANSKTILTEVHNGLNIGSEGKRELSLVAMHCICELLVEKPYFNLSNTLVSLVIRQLTNETPNRRAAKECLIKLFERDAVGEISLEVVRCLADAIKKKRYKLPPIVLLPLLHLPLGRDPSGALTNSEKTDDYHKHKLGMSRKEKKRNKLERRLERDTRETRATESRTYISLVRSKIANIVFSIYIHILKLERSGPLLSPALEGVSHFSQVISVEYFLDLLRFLSELLSSPSSHLSTKQRLYCLHTSCTVLFSQQTQDISVDPKSICQHMYSLLLELPSELSTESTKLLINTLLLMLNSSQCMLQERALGFAKRICTCSLVKTTCYAAGLLFSLRSLLKRDFITDNLLTNDPLAGAAYKPGISDPDVCEAKSTCLWELSLLRSHYHPVIRKQAHYLSEGSALVGKRNSLKLASDRFHTCDEILEATSLYHTDPFEDIKLEQLVESKKRQERVVKKYHTNLFNGVARVYKNSQLPKSCIVDFSSSFK